MVDNVAEALDGFREYVDPRDGLGDSPFKLGCMLGDPATPEEIEASWPTGGLPDALLRLWSVSCESKLFVDVDYAQWGLVLLSPAASAQRTAEQREQRPNDFRGDDVVIGEFLGDLELLVLAPSESGSRAVLIALPLDSRQDWFPVAECLAQFLVKYRESLGSKYWE